MGLLGDPQRTFPVIHVTGTNGKTSTTRLAERLLRELGLTTGRFTSPHLHDIRERIALDGAPIAADKFISAYSRVLPAAKKVDAQLVAAGEAPLAFFEVLTAVAFVAFAKAGVNAVVVEVGIGGTHDSTNIVDAEVAVVTPIGMDHMQILGDTLEAIATDKSGIIKAGAVVISSFQEPAAATVLAARAQEVGATLALEGSEFCVLSREAAPGGQYLTLCGLGGEYDDLFLPLYGAHQAQNAAVAVAAVEAFMGVDGRRTLDATTVRAALAGASSPGRLEVVRREPTVVVDAAHNPAGALVLRAAVRDSFHFVTMVGVVAILEGKAAAEMLEILEPVLDQIIVTRTTSARAMSPDALGALASAVFGVDRVTVVDSLTEAIALARVRAGESGAVLVTGSVTTAAEARKLLGAV